MFRCLEVSDLFRVDNSVKILQGVRVVQEKRQSTLVISKSLISNNRLSQSENLVPVCTWKSNDG